MCKIDIIALCNEVISEAVKTPFSPVLNQVTNTLKIMRDVHKQSETRIAELEADVKFSINHGAECDLAISKNDARIEELQTALRHIVQWSDAVWTSGYGGEVHPAWQDVQEGRKLL